MLSPSRARAKAQIATRIAKENGIMNGYGHFRLRCAHGWLRKRRTFRDISLPAYPIVPTAMSGIDPAIGIGPKSNCCLSFFGCLSGPESDSRQKITVLRHTRRNK
jgi:hypothetical protein